MITFAHPRNRAFTLIELSIVLVLIGLIVGGILSGNELIKNAKVRKTVSLIDNVKTATTAFINKFACMPGDCEATDDLGLSSADDPVLVGNMKVNGQVIENGPPNFTGEEGYLFWVHLSQAGLIAETFSYSGTASVFNDNISLHSPAVPMNIAASLWATIPDTLGGVLPDTDNYLWIANLQFAPAAAVAFGAFGALDPLENYSIDFKIDDGYPSTGSVKLSRWRRGFLTIDSDDTDAYGSGGASSNVCGDNDVDPPVYNTLNTSRHARTLCKLQIRLGL